MDRLDTVRKGKRGLSIVHCSIDVDRHMGKHTRKPLTDLACIRAWQHQARLQVALRSRAESSKGLGALALRRGPRDEWGLMALARGMQGAVLREGDRAQLGDGQRRPGCAVVIAARHAEISYLTLGTW